MAYSPHETRATNVPLTVTSGAHVTNFTVDQTIARPAGRVVREIGTVELVAGTESIITVGTAGTTGFVILDALQLKLAEVPPQPDPKQCRVFQEGISPTEAYTHDAVYVRSSDGASNFDDDPDRELIVGTTAGGVPDVLRSLLQFDLVGIPAAEQIGAASLVLTTHSNTGIDNGGEDGNPTFNVYSYGFDIDEASATWDQPGTGDATGGGTFGTLLSSASFDVTATSQAISFGDTPEFRSAVSDALAGDGILRLIVAKNDESTVGTHEFARFYDETATTASDRPELRVTIDSSDFAITAYKSPASEGLLTLSWISAPGESYTVAYSLDLIDWSDGLATGVPADAGETTSGVFDLALADLAAERRIFFRVEKQ